MTGTEKLKVALVLQLFGAFFSVAAGSGMIYYWIVKCKWEDPLGIFFLIFPLYDLFCGLVNGFIGLISLFYSRLSRSPVLAVMQVVSMLNCNALTPICGILVLVMRNDPEITPFLGLRKRIFHKEEDTGI